MAIRYLDNINLEGNQLLNTSLQKLASNPTGFQGQIIFNTTSSTFNYYNGAAWIALDGTGDITGVTAGTGLSGGGTSGSVTVSVDYLGSDNIINSAPSGTVVASDVIIFTDVTDNAVKKTAISALPFTNNLGTVTSVGPANGTFINSASSAITVAGTLKYDLSATGTPSASTFLRGDNSWAAVAGYSGWTVREDSGTDVVASGDTVDIAGGTGLSSALSVVGTTNTLTVNLNNTTVTAGSYSLASITVDAQGRITSAAAGTAGSMSTFNVKGDSGASQAITNGNTISLLGGVGIVTAASATDTITIRTDLNELPTLAAAGFDNDIIFLQDQSTQGKVAMSNVSLNLWGAPTTSLSIGSQKLINVLDPTLAQDGATKNYVDTTFAGSGALIYQGGYDASVAPPSVGVLQGWTYAVTVAGTGGGLFNPLLEVGDLIIANKNTPISAADWTEINKNIDVATATVLGIANFPTSGGLSVSGGGVSLPNVVTAGTVGSATQSPTITVDAKGRVTSRSNNTIQISSAQVTGFCSSVRSCEAIATEYVTSIGDGVSVAIVVLHKLKTRDVMVQVFDNVSFDTIEVSVVRTDADSVTINTTQPLGANAARVLIKSIGS